MSKDFEPRIIAFCCNWCAYAGADLAGVSRLQMPANFRIVRVMCSGRIDPLFILRAIEDGADGVIVMGCHPGDCHYVDGNLKAEKRVKFLKNILEPMGLSDRVELQWVAASEGGRFQKVITEFTDKIKKLGPSPIKMKPPSIEISKEKQKRYHIYGSLVSIAKSVDFQPKGPIEIPENEVMEGYGFPKYDLEKCIGCGACYVNCPEEVIELSDIADKRIIGHYYFNCRTCKKCEEICPKEAIEIKTGFDLQAFLSSEPVKDIDLNLKKCKICGNYFATDLQLEDIKRIIGEGNKDEGIEGVEFPMNIFEICPECKRKIMAKNLKEGAIQEPIIKIEI